MTATEHPTVGKGSSAIEWTEKTWNPVTGCSKVSPGCDHCYAETLSLRFGWSKKPWLHENAAENVVLHPERLDHPLKWRKPCTVFVNSMSDLFHELVPFTYIHKVFSVMQRAERHTFQVLTKRPERMAEYMQVHASQYPVPANVWLGTSIESWRYNWRADALRKAPAAVRFLSLEPLLDTLYPPHRLDRGLDLTDIHWVIVGGESGLNFRPMDVEWVREIQTMCEDEGVPFFFKQWGGRTPKAGGRELYGRTWDEMPRAASNQESSRPDA